MIISNEGQQGEGVICVLCEPRQPEALPRTCSAAPEEAASSSSTQEGRLVAKRRIPHSFGVPSLEPPVTAQAIALADL